MKHSLYYILPIALILLTSCGSKKIAAKADSPLPVEITSGQSYIHLDTAKTEIIEDTAETCELATCDTLKYTDYTQKLTRGSMKVDYEREIDIIVVHSSHALGTDTFNVDGVINLYNRYSVGAHYLIARDGEIYKLAEENDIAFHAGESTLPSDPSRHSLNKSSIGIEIINSPISGPTEAQYEALAKLSEDIQSRHDIKYIYGHSDIAPSRKSDPWAFDWKRYFNLISFSNPTKKENVQSIENKDDSGKIEEVIIE